MKVKKIRAELCRRLSNIDPHESADMIKGRVYELRNLLSFLDTLEQEPGLMQGTKEFCRVADNIINTANGKANEVPKLRGWVARDKDGTINLFYEKPRKWNYEWVTDGAIDWHQLDSELYPELTWSDKPIEVELEIHRV